MKEQVREANDIVEVIQEFAELKKIGRIWFGLCPFQEEGTASFAVYPENFYCFSCGEYGDVFKFIQLKLGMSFPEALKYLAKRKGIKPFPQKSTNKPTKRILRKKDFTPVDQKKMQGRIEEYCDNIPQGIRKARGLSDTVIERYEIGFAERHWKTAEPYKDHRNCITIPITKEKKLINIRYHTTIKGKKIKDLPYDTGLEYATWLYPEEQLNNEILIFAEGELDALCCISHGIPAITKTCGATTWKKEFTDHFRHKTIYIIQDCDPPGQKGALRIAQELLGTVKEIKIIKLGLRNKGDLTDWFVTYDKTKEELEELISRTKVMPLPRKTTTKQEEIRRMAEDLSGEALTLGKLLSIEFAPGQFWVNKGLVPKGAFVLLAGLTKRGKTTLTLQLCLRLIQGHCTFLRDFKIETAPRILYIFAENSAQGLQNIIKKQLSGLAWAPSEKDFQRLILQPRGRVFLDNSDGLSILEELLHIHTPDLAVLDPISRFISKDINEMRNVNRIFDGLHQIGNGITWLFIHHYRKPARQDINEGIYKTMGSSAFANNCDTFIGLERTDKHRTGLYSTLYFVLRRDRPIEPTNLYWNTENLLFEAVEKRDVLAGGVRVPDVVRVLKEEFKGKAAYSLLTASVAEKYKITKQRVGELLREAKEMGLASKEMGHFGRWFSL